MKVKIRKAIKKDLPDIIKLWEEMRELHKNLPETQMLRDFERMVKEQKNRMEAWVLKNMRSRKSKVLVATFEKRPVAYLMAQVQKSPDIFVVRKKMYVSDLSVTKGYRGKGIGSMLLKEIAKIAKKSGIKYITLEVHPLNKRAIKFYKREGLEEQHIRLVKKV